MWNFGKHRQQQRQLPLTQHQRSRGSIKPAKRVPVVYQRIESSKRLVPPPTTSGLWVPTGTPADRYRTTGQLSFRMTRSTSISVAIR